MPTMLLNLIFLNRPNVNQISFTNANFCYINNQFTNHIKLMKTWKYKFFGIGHDMRNLLLSLCFTIIK